MYHLFPIVLRRVMSRKASEVTVKTRTAFIDPGIICRKTLLSHCASVQPNSTHAFADGMTLTRWPSIESFKADQTAAEG